METRRFELPEGKVNSEQLVAEIRERTGLEDIGLQIHNGGDVEKTQIVNGKFESRVETIEPAIEITLNDSSKFGKALEAIQAHAPVKDDSESIADKERQVFEEKLLELPLVQKLVSDIASMKGK